MTDETGWEHYATLQDGIRPDYEEGDYLNRELDSDEYRVANVLGSGRTVLEKQATEVTRWVPIAQFDGSQSFMMAEQFVEDTGLSEYRVVDVVNGDVLLEVEVEDD